VVKALSKLSVFKYTLLKSNTNLLQMLLQFALLLRALHESVRLRTQLVHLGQEAPVSFLLIAAEVHLSQLQGHALQVELRFLLGANRVLKISQQLAVPDLLLTNRQERDE